MHYAVLLSMTLYHRKTKKIDWNVKHHNCSSKANNVSALYILEDFENAYLFFALFD